jgi:signal transduction histidine kinase
MRPIAFLVFAALSIIPLHAAEPEFDSKAEAVAMVKRVQDMFKQDYKWPNPQTNKIKNKSSYVEKMGDYVVGVGVYRQ